jgi:hypothetical protein
MTGGATPPASPLKLGRASSLHRAIRSNRGVTIMNTFIQRCTAGASLLGGSALVAMLAMTAMLFVRPF